MTEDSAPRRSRWSGLATLLLIVLLAAASYGGWLFYRQAQERAAAEAAQWQRLAKELADSRSETAQLRQQQASLAERLQGTGEELAKLATDISGGRNRARLFGVEQLLLLANDRVQLAHDAHGAATALELAQDRMSGLAEPGLFEVRKAVAEERAALLAAPQADHQAVALSLGGLIAHTGALPLRSAPTHVPAPAMPAAGSAPEGAGWWARGWAKLRELLGAVFIVHRSDKPVDRLLPPEQETLVLNLFALKLESARAAVLIGDGASYHGALDSAVQWLDDYYRLDDPGVSAARAELVRLRALELNPPLPDVSRSLNLLRAYLDAGR